MLFCFVPAADFLSVFWWAPHVLAAAHDYFLPIKPCTKTPWQQSKHSLFYSVCIHMVTSLQQTQLLSGYHQTGQYKAITSRCQDGITCIFCVTILQPGHRANPSCLARDSTAMSSGAPS